MQYLWQFYLLIGIILLQGILLTFGNKTGKIIFVWLCFLELAFIAGFRDWNIGNDTQNYVQAFLLSINYPELIKSHMEPGYLFLNRLLATFTTNPQMLLITTSIFIIGVWLRTLYKYSISLCFSVLLFVILNYDLTLTMIRQEISMCMVLLSIPYIIRRQFIPFLFVVCMASSIHMTAIVSLVLYFLYPFSFKSKYMWVWAGLALFAFIFLAPILDQIINITGRYEGYKGKILLGEETKVASLAKMAVQLAITGFCYVSYKYLYLLKAKEPLPLKVSFLLWCSVIACGLQFISIRGTVLERLVIYFSAFNLISIPYFVRCYPKSMRVLVTIGLLSCFILYQSIIFVYRPEWNHVLPFKFCF